MEGRRYIHESEYYKREKEKLEKKSFKRRIKVLYEGLDVRYSLKRAYFFIYCARRIVFVIVGLFLKEENLVAP